MQGRRVRLSFHRVEGAQGRSALMPPEARGEEVVEDTEVDK